MAEVAVVRHVLLHIEAFQLGCAVLSEETAANQELQQDRIQASNKSAAIQ